MATLKVVLLKANPNKDGKPVVIQINHHYKTRRVTLFSIDPKLFNGKVSRKHPRHIQLNNIINREMARYQERIDRLDASGIPYHIEDITDRYKENHVLLTDLVTTYAERLTDINKHTGARQIRNLADMIKEYDPKMRVTDVRGSWLDNFANFLRNRETITSDTTVGKYLKNLKTVLRSDLTDFFNKAVFNYKVPSSEPEIEALTTKEMKLWQSGDIPDRLEIYRDFFTFMVHCWGTRVSDVLTIEPSQIKNGHIHFRELKTGSRKGYGKIKKVAVNDTLQAIIDKYIGMSKHYLFPFLKARPSDPKIDTVYRKHIDSRITTVNKNLKLIAAYLSISKKVTNHVARHTFASMMDDANVDIRDIQRMLNHSKLEQTIKYIHRIRKYKELNVQAQKVLGKLEEE